MRKQWDGEPFDISGDECARRRRSPTMPRRDNRRQRKPWTREEDRQITAKCRPTDGSFCSNLAAVLYSCSNFSLPSRSRTRHADLHLKDGVSLNRISLVPPIKDCWDPVHGSKDQVTNCSVTNLDAARKDVSRVMRPSEN